MRGKHSGVTSDAMSGPYCTATGAITVEDTTETTRVTQQDSRLYVLCTHQDHPRHRPVSIQTLLLAIVLRSWVAVMNSDFF